MQSCPVRTTSRSRSTSRCASSRSATSSPTSRRRWRARASRRAALTLELTESALVHDAERTLELLHELKELGVRFAIDDFGTGYSSLAYLHRFPVDVLKIDRSFVTSVVSGRQSPALARAIVDLGRSLDLVTIAEGIEHDVELDQFRELDCTQGQGYLFARPAAPAEIAALLVGALASPATAVPAGVAATSFDAAAPRH